MCSDCVEYRSKRCIQCMPYPHHRHSPPSMPNCMRWCVCAFIVCVHILLYYSYIFSAKRMAIRRLCTHRLGAYCGWCAHAIIILFRWFDRSIYPVYCCKRDDIRLSGIWPLLKFDRQLATHRALHVLCFWWARERFQVHNSLQTLVIIIDDWL